MLEELVVCPVLWKGQWQVLPTLPGLRRLVLVHCRCAGVRGGAGGGFLSTLCF